MIMTKKIEDIIRASIEVKQQLVSDESMLNNLTKCVELIVTAFKNGNKVLLKFVIPALKFI